MNSKKPYPKNRNQFNTDEFIKKAQEIPGNKEKYDYSQVNYVNKREPVTIICKKHGPFEQTPDIHLNGGGCKTCEFIKKAQEIPGNKEKYDYSLVDYQYATAPVEIICKKHGPFEQTPNTHLKGGGCKKCQYDKTRATKESWLNDVFKKYPENKEKYDYSLVDYQGSKVPVEIICKKHGPFFQSPDAHLRGRQCRKCAYEGTRRTKESWLDSVFKMYPDNKEKYDYSLVDYVNDRTKVTIICKKHGPFLQYPSHHRYGGTCPKCLESKGERLIYNILENNNIKNERQKKFKGCFSLSEKINRCFYLPFDFYLPDYNAVIEYDGAQHFKPIDFFGGENEFNRIKLRDKLKNEYCEKNNIKMIRVPYEIKNDELESYILNQLKKEKKIIKLTESELTKIIQKVIMENDNIRTRFNL